MNEKETKQVDIKIGAVRPSPLGPGKKLELV